MREIKFRGYSKYNNTWYYGLIGKFDGKYYIECEGGVKPFVEEASIGQYTGFQDKNGKEIYEGDIIKWWNEKCIVEFGAGKWLAKKMTSNKVILLFEELSHIEVIGNIYEDKLKEGK